MTPTYSPEQTARLIAEVREDDARLGDDWRACKRWPDDGTWFVFTGHLMGVLANQPEERAKSLVRARRNLSALANQLEALQGRIGGAETDGASSDGARVQYKDSESTASRLDVVQPVPREPMTTERLQEIGKLVTLLGVPVKPDPMSPAGIIPEMLAEIERLQAECKRLQRCILASAVVFTPA